MKAPKTQEIIEALAEMKKDLTETKDEAQDFYGDLDEMQPDELDFDVLDSDEDVTDEEKEVAKKIETPADAKKVLEEAKKDIQAVVDNIDGVVGQTEEEEKTAGITRVNEKYASNMVTLSESAESAIKDAKDALKHWAFLKKVHNPVKNLGNKQLSDAYNTIKQASTVVEKVKGIFGINKKGTAVPPTGAEYSGDKFPNGKNPAEVENRAWKAGADKFDKDKKFEDGKVNPAKENRLTDVDYHYDNKPFVNATLKRSSDNKYESYWEITDAKENKRVIASFLNTPAALGPKNKETFAEFTSDEYGMKIAKLAVKAGLSKVKEELNGVYASFNPSSLKVIAADKSGLNAYYSDAYGSPEYSKKLVAGGDKGEKMNVGYTPKDEHVEDKNNEKTKDGPGVMSSKNKKASASIDKIALANARARKAVELAQVCASRGMIPFVYKDVEKKASEFMLLSDEQFNIKKATIEEFPIVNEAALKTAHIPDTEVGIVGNSAVGVHDPSGKVKTEDLNKEVASDAPINKNASIVPQSNDLSVPKEAFSNLFNNSTIVDKLKAKGFDTNKLRKPTYKNS